MKITSFEMWLDGGSISITTDEGQEFWIDNRIETTIKGQLYSGFPLPDKSNLISSIDPIRIAIKEALKQYEMEESKKVFYQECIDDLSNSL